MNKINVDENQIRILITAKAIIASILLLYLSGHVQAWDRNVERYQFYSITIFLSIILYTGCILTLLRGIALTFQSLHAQNPEEREDLYHVAYNLFILVLLAVGIGIFVAFLSIIRQVIFRVPSIPIQVLTPWWVFLALFLLLFIYIVILIFKPKLIYCVIRFARN